MVRSGLRVAVAVALVPVLVAGLLPSLTFAATATYPRADDAGPSAMSTVVGTPLGTGTNYPTYLANNARTDDVGAQGAINVSTASTFRELWSFRTNGSVWAQPIAVNGVVYVGSNDGYEYALDAGNGTFLWKTYLGIDNATPICGGAPGVTSTATYLGGKLYVSGGYPAFYALNATTGRILWSVPIGGPNANGFYLWASPLVFNRTAYVGIASQCDEPLVAAGLEAISITSHREVAYFNSSTPYPNGSSIWGSPSVDAATNTIFVTTGNPYKSLVSTYGESIVALNASTLAVERSWQVPKSQITGDGDFGVTPTLFDLPSGAGAVAAENKNGYLYEWYQSNLTIVWERHLVTGNGDHFSTSFADGKLFAVSHDAKIGGITYNTSLLALNPTTGATLWQLGISALSGASYSVPVYVKGVVAVAVGTSLYLLNAASGQVLYHRILAATATPPVAVSRGELFLGAGDDVSAFDAALGASGSGSASSGVAPLNESFRGVGRGGVAPYSFSWRFGDGSTATGADPTHLYSGPGNFTVSVSVRDVVGSTATYSWVISVTTPGRRRDP